MHRWLCALTLAAALPAFAAEAPVEDPAAEGPATPTAEAPARLAHWADAHSAAAFSLADWVQKNPEAARQVFWWDRKHPVRAQRFLRWALQNPTGTVEDFASAHGNWPASDLVLRPNAPALQALLAWGRAHPDALNELLATRRGLAWMGFHQLAPLWQDRASEPRP